MTLVSNLSQNRANAGPWQHFSRKERSKNNMKQRWDILIMSKDCSKVC